MLAPRRQLGRFLLTMSVPWQTEIMSPDQLLAALRKRYLGSGNFNGLHLHGSYLHDNRAACLQLLKEGHAEIVSERDYLNPHIRPWPSKRTLEDQLLEVRDYSESSYGFCLYPTNSGMRGVRIPARYRNNPFQLAMARGRSTLEIAYFSMDVLEPYRNDPRYQFTIGDFGADMSISDDAFTDAEELDRDKVSLSHIGFAYDLSHYDADDPLSPIIRRVAAFYGDLAKLTHEHQQRWHTYAVDGAALQPHPAWWMNQMGHWRDRLGPFERLFQTLEELNILTAQAFDETLFRHTERPRNFGWLLRAAQRDWDEFVSQFDKLLSENLRSAFFDTDRIPKKDARDQIIGTLNRLGLFMRGHGASAADVDRLLGPLREVRRARQLPAHALRANVTDKTFVHKQVSLLSDVNGALLGLRNWLKTHRANADWTPSYDEPQAFHL